MKIALAIITFYCLFSISEWFFHRCVMHLADDPISTQAVDRIPAFLGVRQRHAKHHSWLNTETPLASRYNEGRDWCEEPDPHERWLAEFEGLYFLWPATVGVFVPLMIIFWGVNMVIFQLSPWFILAISVLFVVYQSAMWNAMHPLLHGKTDRRLKWYEGIDLIDPNWLKNTRLYHWLWENHVLHHLIPGSKQGNFNVTAPFADYFFRTHNRSADRFHLDRQTFTVTPVKQTVRQPAPKHAGLDITVSPSHD